MGKTRNREPSGNNYVPSFMQVQFLPNYCGLFFISSSKAVIEMLEKNYKIHCSLNNIVICFYICVEGCICTSIFFFCLSTSIHAIKFRLPCLSRELKVHCLLALSVVLFFFFSVFFFFFVLFCFLFWCFSFFLCFLFFWRQGNVLIAFHPVDSCMYVQLYNNCMSFAFADGG